MALETLKGLVRIGGFMVARGKPADMSWDVFDKTRDTFPINITEKMNCISFKIQNGPIKEHGVNGCQVDTLIETARLIIEGLDKKFPNHYNNRAIGCLNHALTALKLRTKERIEQGIEGTSN